MFVARVLEGVEGTLGEMVGRVQDQELNRQLDTLRSQVAAVRIGIEKPLTPADADRTAFGR
jgi:hypothetical protein